MNKSILVSLIITGLLFFVLGGGIGVLYQTQQDAPQVEVVNNFTESLKVLGQRSIYVSGVVKDIDGRTVTLVDDANNSFIINIKENAEISSILNDGVNYSETKQPINMEDIKNGDRAYIDVKLLQNGILEGQSILIYNQIKISDTDNVK